MSGDIFDVLTTQYEKAIKMLAALAEIPRQNPSERRKMGQSVARELISLDEVEAQVLYKRLEEVDQLRNIVREHREKQDRVDDAVWRLLNMDPDDPDWEARVSTLSRELEEHVANEKNKLFPQARDVLDKDEAENMVELYISLQDRRRHQIQH